MPFSSLAGLPFGDHGLKSNSAITGGFLPSFDHDAHLCIIEPLPDALILLPGGLAQGSVKLV